MAYRWEEFFSGATMGLPAQDVQRTAWNQDGPMTLTKSDTAGEV
jgi:hypothetical protein